MDQIRAWKDPEYRKSLGETGQDHPAGLPGLAPITDEELSETNGAGTSSWGTMGCCSGIHFTAWSACGVVCVITETLCN